MASFAAKGDVRVRDSGGGVHGLSLPWGTLYVECLEFYRFDPNTSGPAASGSEHHHLTASKASLAM
jgi:hypothetical protein